MQGEVSGQGKRPTGTRKARLGWALGTQQKIRNSPCLLGQAHCALPRLPGVVKYSAWHKINNYRTNYLRPGPAGRGPKMKRLTNKVWEEKKVGLVEAGSRELR